MSETNVRFVTVLYCAALSEQGDRIDASELEASC